MPPRDATVNTVVFTPSRKWWQDIEEILDTQSGRVSEESHDFEGFYTNIMPLLGPA